MSKLFIERLYPFFKWGDSLMTNTSKRGKKGDVLKNLEYVKEIRALEKWLEE